ncbi:MAG: glycosyltransferase family 4 protein [Ruminococcaceae bacterium]|nr:glycosyltransferase family 4 protein [Oscillospiraceae bacterium]
MKKVLLTATVQSHICQFHKPLCRVLHGLGYEIHVAARDNLAEKNGLVLDFADKVYDVPFARSPFSKQNLGAYRMLRGIIEEQKYDAVHCNTPVGGVLTRLACRKARKQGMRVLYTAHGFHFYKGAPKKNWLLYYPIEWLCAHWTDRLLTITDEDFALATRKFRKTTVCRIHGVGADQTRFYPIPEKQRDQLRQQNGITPEQRVILCVGELLPNKNQKTAIAAMQEVIKAQPNALLCIAGNGPEQGALQAQIESLGLQEHVRLLGYTTKIQEWYGMSDVLVACSYREGLPMNVIEAMLCGVPVVASVNRGHRELIKDAENGYLVQPDDAQAYAAKILSLLQNNEHCLDVAQAAHASAQDYRAERVEHELAQIYQNL